MNKFFIPILCLFLSILSFGQNSLLIEDVTVIPMHINKVLEHQDVVLQNGKILEIRNHIDNDSIYYELGTINGSGKFLLPSFSDAHVHLPLKENLQNYFLMNLVNGVTTLRSMRGEEWHLDIEKTDLTPNLILASPAITSEDDLTTEKAKELLKKYKSEGFDFVKILGVKDENVFDALISESKANQLPLAGHCPQNIGIFKVCESSVFQSIEHLMGFYELQSREQLNDAVNLTIKDKVYECPTLDYYYAMQQTKEELRVKKGVEFLPNEVISEWEVEIKKYDTENTKEQQAQNIENGKATWDYFLNLLNYLYEQGVPLLLSPDASGLYSIPGFGIHSEMQHYSEAGISNFDILKATCYNLSAMRGTETEWGTIKEGATSDLVLLNANPLNDIQNTENIAGIVLHGKYYTQEELYKKLKSTK